MTNNFRMFILLTLIGLFLIMLSKTYIQKTYSGKQFAVDVKLATFRATCQPDSCFDYTHCNVTSGFPVYLYPLAINVTDKRLLLWRDALAKSPYITNVSETACIYLYLVADSFKPAKLSHWTVQGQNHVIINFMSTNLIINESHVMLAQTEFHGFKPIRGFDIPLPYMELLSETEKDLPLLLPAHRTNLLSFRGAAPDTDSTIIAEYIAALSNLRSTKRTISITTNCVTDSSCEEGSWCLCAVGETEHLMQSTFVVIPNDAYMPYSQLARRLYFAILNGAIPVILGSHHPLPMDELIPWREAVIKLPLQRVSELVYIISNFAESDIVSLKKHGRSLLENHLMSIGKITETLLDILRIRLYIPPHKAPSPKSSLMYTKKNPMRATKKRGATKKVHPSVSYIRQFTSWQRDAGCMAWSRWSYLYPSTPWDPILPVDVQLYEPRQDHQPINRKADNKENELSKPLGGNHPQEQFTIIVLTYDRPKLLLKQLAQFDGLPYLNKVLVVWNHPAPPPSTLKWPRLHVKIEVIKSAKNSLNNRFLPYEEVETDAVLTLDDDVFLKHEEIVFAFRVWREHRDQLVGFPGRTWAWNMKEQIWFYQPLADCQMSLVLTGAAFFHKFYMYQYSYFMPQAIRDRVDELTNCEDIAMNFLISHISGKPPVKVSEPKPHNCVECSNSSLSKDASHYIERNECIQYFVKLYGYLPLLYTQSRADSILYNMEASRGKEKCFTLV